MVAQGSLAVGGQKVRNVHPFSTQLVCNRLAAAGEHTNRHLCLHIRRVHAIVATSHIFVTYSDVENRELVALLLPVTTCNTTQVYV